MFVRNKWIRNWKTLLLGIFTCTGYVLWVLNRIDTQSFIALLGFMTTVGFLTMQKPKVIVKDKESVES